MLRYIADCHFGHENVIKYDNRPFKDIDEMDRKMVELWNDHVSNEDTVFILGDFVWKGFKSWCDIVKNLNGHLVFVKGNHDKAETIINICAHFKNTEYVGEQTTVVDNDRHVVLNHCPMSCYPNSYHGWYHLYGHVHVSFDYNVILSTQRALEALYMTKFKMFNVGAMLIGYYPRTLDEIETIFKNREAIEELPLTNNKEN